VSARAALIAVLILSGMSLAQAQPNIPPNELAGRERERFIDPFPQPKASTAPLIKVPKARPDRKRICRVKGTSRRVAC
jgi:hypothetical protein